MIFLGSRIIFPIIFFQLAVMAQNTPPMPQPGTPAGAEAQSPPPPASGTEELTDAGMVMKTNKFNYDANEGRDPFKIYRELLFLTDPSKSANPMSNTNPQPVKLEGIHAAIVPNDVTIVGILYRKEDPIVLVKVKNAKGIFKLKANARIGRNEGRVVEIYKDRMVVEQVKDFDGQKYTEKIVMKIREKKR